VVKITKYLYEQIDQKRLVCRQSRHSSSWFPAAPEVAAPAAEAPVVGNEVTEPREKEAEKEILESGGSPVNTQRINRHELGERLKKRRIQLGLSQSGICTRMGFANQGMISKLERGESCPIGERVRKWLDETEDLPGPDDVDSADKPGKHAESAAKKDDTEMLLLPDMHQQETSASDPQDADIQAGSLGLDYKEAANRYLADMTMTTEQPLSSRAKIRASMHGVSFEFTSLGDAADFANLISPTEQAEGQAPFITKVRATLQGIWFEFASVEEAVAFARLSSGKQ
jgi:transcriptional regulator with XRE-family HTH domain